MIALASDHAGLPLKKLIMEYLEQRRLEYKDFGTYSEESCNYPEYALLAATAVVSGECDKGILCCGTGVGISIAANKVQGIRCATCSEPYSALLSRQHNNSNMLALGSRVVGSDLAIMTVESWLDGEFEGGRHADRVWQIEQIEKGNPLKKN